MYSTTRSAFPQILVCVVLNSRVRCNEVNDMGLKESTYSSFTCAVKALLTKYCHQKVVGQQPSSLKILKCQKGLDIAPLKSKLCSSLYQCNTWKHTTLLPPSSPTFHPPRFVLQAAKRRSSVICQPNVKVSKDSWWTRLGFFVERKVVGEVGKGIDCRSSTIENGCETWCTLDLLGSTCELYVN